MTQPWLTMSDWPVSALVLASAKKQHRVGDVIGGRELAVQMDRQQSLPVGKREIDHGLDDLDAGVAGQHVDLAILFDDVGDALLHHRLVGDVHGDRERIRPFGADLPRGGIGGVEVEIGDHRGAAIGGEAQHDLFSDAAGGTGDEGDFSVETRHSGFLEERGERCEGYFR